MFGLGRFGRLRFNVRMEDDQGARLALVLEAAVRALLGRGENVALGVCADSAMGMAAAVSAGLPVSADWRVLAEGAATPTTWCMLRGAMGLEAGASGLLGRDCLVAAGWVAEMTGWGWIGADLWGRIAAGALMAGTGRLGGDLRMREITADAVVDALVATERFETEEAVFDLAIPVGGTLVVDSEGYEVVLDGVDVIAKQMGTWLWLDRDVVEVTFEAAKGNVKGLVVDGYYWTRWL